MSSTRSKIFISEITENTEKKTSAKDSYVTAYVIDDYTGERKCAMFTQKDIDRAVARAEKNPEDTPEELSGIKYVLSYLFK